MESRRVYQTRLLCQNMIHRMEIGQHVARPDHVATNLERTQDVVLGRTRHSGVPFQNVNYSSKTLRRWWYVAPDMNWHGRYMAMTAPIAEERLQIQVLKMEHSQMFQVLRHSQIQRKMENPRLAQDSQRSDIRSQHFSSCIFHRAWFHYSGPCYSHTLCRLLLL